MDKQLVAVFLTVFIVSSATIYFLASNVSESVSIMEFEENDELVFYIDGNGDVFVQGQMRLPPSPFADFINYVILMQGEETYENGYVESIRGSFARYGFEVDNIQVEVSIADGIRMDVSWRLWRAARWNGENWELSFGWPDPESAAEESIAEQEVSWVNLRSVARQYGYDEASFWQYYRMEIIPPENAENVWSETINTYENVDYGGGSYLAGSVHMGENGRSIVENGVLFFTTEGEFTISPDNLVENSLAYTVYYSAPWPEDQSFKSSVERVRLDLKFGLALRDNYPVLDNGILFWMSPGQLLYNSAKAILAENSGVDFSPESVQVSSPENERGDWNAAWETLSKDQYLQLAQEVVDNVSSSGALPGAFETSVGEVRFRDVLYMFLRLLHQLYAGAQLPENVIVVPSPSGDLEWGSFELLASYSYFLLPDTYVITETGKVENVLGSFPENLDNWGLAEEICDWSGSNLSYGLSFTPPTSEDVLESKHGQCRDYTNVFLALARTSGLPARRVIGWVTSNWTPPAGWGFTSTQTSAGETVALHAWAQVYIPGQGWIAVEPQSKRPNLYVGVLPYVPYRQLEQTWMGALAGYESARGLL